jgi:toxin ParE1/3/4
MAKVQFRQAAIDDLNDIWTYTVMEWSEEQADLYYERIASACTQIAGNPVIGKTYETIHQNLRGLRTGKHIIFYRIISEEDIEIIRILHARMDLKGRLGE